jgi:hypothetical protein
MTYARRFLVSLLILIVLGWQAHDDARAIHDGSGAHVDQMSIDMGPPGVATGVEGNGTAAIGDRDIDGLPDAEGYDTPDPGDAAGICGNSIDDDLADSDANTIPDTPDGVADDGCAVTLTTRETCAEVIDDGILNADEDAVAAGQDRLSVDVTVGAQPGPAGGIPASRGMISFQYSFNWVGDLIIVRMHGPYFLILTSGGAQPFTIVDSPLPDAVSPFTTAVLDGGATVDSGPGVLSRFTIEGRNQDGGVLSLSTVSIQDNINVGIPIDTINRAYVVVSHDGPDGGTVIGDSSGEIFTCAMDADSDLVPDGADNCDNTANFGQEDVDGDTVGDACDNCPSAPNANQINTDGDSMGDACDPDDDNDCIEDNVDGTSLRGDQSLTVSANFIDTPPGSTSGTRISACANIVVSDVADPTGVRVTVSSGSPASISGCGSPSITLALPAPSEIVATCGSATVQVIAGPVTETFGCLQATLPTGTTSTVTETSAGVYDVSNSSGSSASITVGGLSLSPGSSATVTDTDCDGMVNQVDTDDDNDGQSDTIETACGSLSLNSASVPERLDTPGDDDLDTLFNEALPSPASDGFDCDGDGWTGNQEGLIFSAGTTANDQDPCGNNGWGSDLAGATNTLNIADIGSFLTPNRAFDGHVGPTGLSYNKFNHTLDDTAPFDGVSGIEALMARWNLATPPHTGTTVINIADLNVLLNGAVGSPARPPMFGGLQAFFTGGGVCPYPP